MGIESPINPDHAWFKGEDKYLRFTLRDKSDGSTWGYEFVLTKRGTTTPVIHKTTEISAIGSLVTVPIHSAETANVVGRVFNYVLRRTDPNNNNVLAFGQATLREAGET